MVRRVAPNDDANGGDGARNGPSAHVESTFLSPLPGLCNSFAHLPTACAVGWILPPLPRLRRKDLLSRIPATQNYLTNKNCLLFTSAQSKS